MENVGMDGRRFAELFKAEVQSTIEAAKADKLIVRETRLLMALGDDAEAAKLVNDLTTNFLISVAILSPEEAAFVFLTEMILLGMRIQKREEAENQRNANP